MAEIEAEFFRTVRPTSLIRRFAEPHEVANPGHSISHRRRPPRRPEQRFDGRRRS